MKAKEIRFKVTIGNSKLGSICSINLPALKTCREDAPCRKLCYANKGNFKRANVINCYENNLQVFLESPEKAKQDILEQLPLIGFCRVHGSGDIVNLQYLEMLIEVAEVAKMVKFMLFTKKYELVNNYIAEGGTIPENVKIIYSGWHGLEMENPYNFPTAYIRLKKVEDSRIKEDAFPCSGKCDKCYMCWKLENGEQVVFNQH